jgi:flagellin-like protein
MKGISPMIATVLLIAFTVAIGGLISVWITGMTNTQTAQVTNQSASQVKCTPSLIIDSVKVTTGTSCITSWCNVTISYSNPSQQTITGITALIPNLASGNLTTTAITTSLGPGSTGVAWDNVSSAPMFVKINGLCSGLPVSATCDNTMACWTA